MKDGVGGILTFQDLHLGNEIYSQFNNHILTHRT